MSRFEFVDFATVAQRLARSVDEASTLRFTSRGTMRPRRLPRTVHMRSRYGRLCGAKNWTGKTRDTDDVREVTCLRCKGTRWWQSRWGAIQVAADMEEEGRRAEARAVLLEDPALWRGP